MALATPLLSSCLKAGVHLLGPHGFQVARKSAGKERKGHREGEEGERRQVGCPTALLCADTTVLGCRPPAQPLRRLLL